MAPRSTARLMKSSPLKTAPLNAPKTLPRATLRWSIAKPVTSESLSMSAMSDRRTALFLRFVYEGQDLAHVRFPAHVRRDAQHRRNAADGTADDRRDIPAGRGEAVGFLGRMGFVEHHDDHIARVVHREHTGEARDVDRLAIMAVDHLLRRAGLAADAIARRIGLLARALHHNQPKQGAHAVAGVLGEDAPALWKRVIGTALQNRGRVIDAAVE